MAHPDPKDCRIVTSVSGGKDSTAMSLWLTDQGLDHDRIFADTGWEHPWTTEYVADYIPEHIGPITHLVSEKYPKGYAQLCRERGAFPGRRMRFCSDELKKVPIRYYISQVAEAESREVINCVGIRSRESAARAKFPEWEWSSVFDCWVWRPLIDWTQKDVIDYHTKHGVRPNPLYLKGAKRVGCWPCIHANKDEVAMVAKLTPWRIDEIRDLEVDVQASALTRYQKKGYATFADKKTEDGTPHRPPTMFVDKGRRMVMVPIDEYVKWAQTSRGGHQLQLHAEYDREQDGCMRWGLCESEGEG